MADRSGFFVGHPVAGWGSGGGSLTALTVTTNTACASNNAYIANSASQLTFTLPASPSLGDRVQVLGLGAGGWQLNANTGQTLYDAQTLGSNGMAGIVGTRDMAIEVVYAGSSTWIVDAGRGAVSAATPQLDPFWSTVTLQIPLNNGITDQSGNNISLTNVGSNVTFSNSSPKFAGTYYGVFNGTSGYLTFSSTAACALYGDFTVEAWVYPTAVGQSSGGRILMGSTAGAISIAQTPSAYTLQLSPTGSGVQLTSTGAMTANQWNHVALTRTSGTVTFWINGANAGSATGITTSYVGGTFGIGCNSGAANNYFQGNICGLRVTNGIARYTAPFTVPAGSWCSVGDTGFDPVWWKSCSSSRRQEAILSRTSLEMRWPRPHREPRQPAIPHRSRTPIGRYSPGPTMWASR